jgi:uncharacterized protein
MTMTDTQRPDAAPVDAFALLRKHHDPGNPTYDLLAVHSVLVAHRARAIADAYARRHPDRPPPDLDFVTEAALLHDIGIGRCRAETIFCFGSAPYIQHGAIGREILEDEGLPRHALVCERHTGAGISAEEVRREKLPLAERDYLPESIEEKIICVADKFYSKNPARLWRPRSLRRIAAGLAQWGPGATRRWLALCAEVLPEGAQGPD